MSQVHVEGLNKLVDATRQRIDCNINDARAFLLTYADVVLTAYNPSDDVILNGITDSSGDGGIDALYIIINHQFVCNVTDLEKHVELKDVRVIIIQSKQSSGFDETTPLKISHHARELFSPDYDDEANEYGYNPQILELSKVVRQLVLDNVNKQPTICLEIFICTSAKETKISSGVSSVIERVRKDLKNDLELKSAEINLWSAVEIVQHNKSFLVGETNLTYNRILNVDKGWLALCKLEDYYNFISVKNSLITKLFDSNIRDFIPDAEVNNEIDATLRAEKNNDFWWMNNGITIIADSCTDTGGNVLEIHEPQIINGLQTSYQVFHYGKQHGSIFQNEERHILVKVIKVKDKHARNAIIKSSNCQTRIDHYQFYALEDRQINLEEFFKDHGWYYERKRNYYKNRMKPYSRRFSLPFLAKAVLALIFRDFDKVLLPPSELLSSDGYKRIFPKYNHNIDEYDYLHCIRITKKTEYLLNEMGYCIRRQTVKKKSYIPHKQLFRIAYDVVVSLLGSDYDYKAMSDIRMNSITKNLVLSVLDSVHE